MGSLALDEIQGTGVDQRPRLPFNGPRDFTGLKGVSSRGAAVPLSQPLQSIALDPLTVADDANFLTEIANQPNVPESNGPAWRSSTKYSIDTRRSHQHTQRMGECTGEFLRSFDNPRRP